MSVISRAISAAFTDPRIGFGLAVAFIAGLLICHKVPLSYNVYNLLVRWRTTLLTALAFTLVLSLLTLMLAFVKGMYSLTKGSGQPRNVIVMSEGATDESFSNLGFANIGDIETQPAVAQDGSRPLMSRETFVIVNQPIQSPVPGRPRRRFLQMRGVDDPAMSGRVHGLKLYDGSQWFADAGVRELPRKPGQTEPSNAIEVVVGEGIAREMALDQPTAMSQPGIGRLTVGDTFPLNNRDWVIVGVMQSEGSTFDSEVWAKRTILGPMFGRENYTTLVLRAAQDFRKSERSAYDHERRRAVAQAEEKANEARANGQEPEAVPVWQTPQSDDRWDAELVKDYFNNGYKKAAVNATIETEYFAALNELNLQFLVAIIFVTIVMSVGGIFGVMNTMFAAISQRVKDIGVLRLLGYRRRSILICFLLESVLIAMLGGLLGVGLGSLSDGWTASSIVGSGQGGGKFVVLRLTVDAQVIAVGCFLSLLLGLLGGLVPSLNAMRLSALQALR